nr:TRAM domain-containing protein [Nocardioidaceae bacterium]
MIGAETETASPSLVGTECELLVGPIAHGGHCVARWAGRVVFVRHSLPGERVLVRITEGDESSRFLRGDAIDVLDAASGRVQPPCPYSGPGRCGGCDFQHVAPRRQRELLGDVVAEQLQRLAGLDWPVQVAAVEPDALGWRTRMGWSVGTDDVVGLRRYR